MPRQPFEARENLAKEGPCQVTFGQLQGEVPRTDRFVFSTAGWPCVSPLSEFSRFSRSSAGFAGAIRSGGGSEGAVEAPFDYLRHIPASSGGATRKRRLMAMIAKKSWMRSRVPSVGRQFPASAESTAS